MATTLQLVTEKFLAMEPHEIVKLPGFSQHSVPSAEAAERRATNRGISVEDYYREWKVGVAANVCSMKTRNPSLYHSLLRTLGIKPDEALEAERAEESAIISRRALEVAQQSLDETRSNNKSSGTLAKWALVCSIVIPLLLTAVSRCLPTK